MVKGLKTMYSTMCMTGKGDSYRAEDGQRGDGRWPPQARDTGRGMRSRVEVYWRPPEGAKLPKGCVCGIWPKAKGVRTQSRRHLNAVKVETGRGKGAKRPARPKLRIDRGGMGGGEGNIPYTSSEVPSNYKDTLRADPAFFNPERDDIFYYCAIVKAVEGGFGGWGGGNSIELTYTSDNDVFKRKFMHELGEMMLIQYPTPTWFEIDPNGYQHCSRTSCVFHYDYSGDTFCSDCWSIYQSGRGL